MPAAEPPFDDLRPVRPPGSRLPGGTLLQATGVLLFLFIPLVLYLFVRHPEPIAVSLAAGAALMLGHRFLARPYMARAIPRKCLWCNRILPAPLDPSTGTAQPPAGTADLSAPILARSTGTLDLLAGGRLIHVRCCAAHRAPTRRFFSFLNLARLPLRLGIFLPLLLLLGALAAASGSWGGGAAGLPEAPFLPAATALFQLLVGLTVSAAAWGYLLLRREDPRPGGASADGARASGGSAGSPGSDGGATPLPVPFPAHNFFLLGVRPLLWIFRLVGAWWIWRGAGFFFRLLA